jgi:hypothetical protein
MTNFFILMCRTNEMKRECGFQGKMSIACEILLKFLFEDYA